jgi:cytochrome P450
MSTTFRRSKTRQPPGPKGLPGLGVLPAFARDPLGVVLRSRDDYGDVVRMPFGMSSTYLIHDPVLIEQVLMGEQRDSVKDRETRQLRLLLGSGLFTSEGHYWRRQRKLAAPPLQAKRIAAYAGTMVECAARAFDEYRDGEVRELHADAMRLTLEIVARSLLGTDTRADSALVARVLDEATTYLGLRLRSTERLLPYWVRTPANRRFRAAVASLDELVHRIIARYRAGECPAGHMLGRFIDMKGEDGESMSDEQVRDEVVTLLLAGHETTSLTLTFAIYLIARHPAVAEKIRAEVDAQLGGRPARWEDIAKLRYVGCAVREALRLYPPVWLIGREAVRNFELGGFAVRTGQQLNMSPYAVQRDPRRFADADSFDPSRWSRPETASLPNCAYFPFGSGPRVCIGNHFAMAEATLVLATFYQRLDASLLHDVSLKLDPVLTLRPLNGVQVRVRRRRPAPLHEHSPQVDR